MSDEIDYGIIEDVVNAANFILGACAEKEMKPDLAMLGMCHALVVLCAVKPELEVDKIVEEALEAMKHMQDKTGPAILRA